MFQPSKYLRNFRNFSKILYNSYLNINRSCSNTYSTDLIKSNVSGIISPYLLNNRSMEMPTYSYMPKIDPTLLGIVEKIEQFPDLISYEEPKQEEITKQAARLIVIRRRKMKKHKLRKLRIRMKYEWAKMRQRRELRKEKRFQDGLIAKMEEARQFDAEKFVKEKLAQANEIPLPTRINGKRLPEFVIKEILERKNPKYLKKILLSQNNLK